MDTFELNGLTFRVRTEYDEQMGPPWQECDGHGVVSDYERRDKLPGERILCGNRGLKRFYDVQATMERARAEGWGLSDEERAALARTLGREPTRGEVLAKAVERDFEYLRGWCNDEWHYCGVIVTLLDVNGNPTQESESLWGVEDNDDSYIMEVARELAEQIADRVGDADTVPARPAHYQIREVRA